MCLMLYMASYGEEPPGVTPDLRVEDVNPSRAAVRQWFSRPHIRFVGAHTWCSCGFPSVIAKVPIEYYEGMPLESDDRDADLRSVRALTALLRRHVETFGDVQLYPISDGDEQRPPKGAIDLPLASIDENRFFFNEGFLYCVRKP
jgi:hypothetical protein